MILGERFYKMSNASFCYGLTPVQHTAYSYLVCSSGQKGYCWPSVKTVAERCGCSEETARKALHVLEERKFIRIEPRYDNRHGACRQTSNYYFLLDPPAPKPRQASTPGNGDEQYSYEQGNDFPTEPLPL